MTSRRRGWLVAASVHATPIDMSAHLDDDVRSARWSAFNQAPKD